MKRKRIRKILIIAFSVCLVAANVTSFTYAVDPVTFTEAETLGATIVDLYGAYNNTSLAYEQLSKSGALTEVVTLYNNYASNASDPYTLAAIGAAAAAAGAIAVVYDAVTGQGYVQLYQEQYISSLDGYWDYTLNDLGFTRNLDGLFEWSLDQNDEIQPVTVFYHGLFPELPVSDNTAANVRSGGFVYTNLSDTNQYSSASRSGVYACYISFDGSSTSNYFYYVLSDSNSGYAYTCSALGNYVMNKTITLLTSSPSNVYGVQVTSTSGIKNPDVPFYYNLNEAYSAFLGRASATQAVYLEPSYYIGDPLQNPVEITLPDPSANDYVAQPRRIKTNIEWNPDWGTPIENPVPGVAYPVTDPDILNDAVPGIWESIVSDGVEVGDPDPEPEDPGADPNEVTIPFLPITLPSFNLNLSGIWHYVVTWVASLGAWFTTLFTIWSCLPYAMVVPVYATLVVVIVLGVYRRFLT